MYRAPVEEQKFVLGVTAGLPDILESPSFEHMSEELVDSILEESGKFAGEVFAPTNRPGDVEGASIAGGDVRVPASFQTAYRQLTAGGWVGITGSSDWGGQALPLAVSQAVNEQLTSANGTLVGCAQLTWGAIEAIEAHGTAEQKSMFLPGLISGAWSGTMNLTEPQAGTDVGAIRTTATPKPDGKYAIRGGKIFISFGEHDLSDNIIHLVLARTPDAGPGSKGLSLFIVPKWHIGDDSRLGERNDVRCNSIEEKLGQHGGPTCVMHYGDNDACTGELLGEEGGGIRAMFTMMNNARINVAIQGVAFAERAYQAADAYARERVQSRGIDADGPVTIIDHPDVRRMLLTQRALIEASRALVYFTAGQLDRARHKTNPAARNAARLLGDLLTPAAKAYATDMGMEVTSSAIQVFGGLGFIEETGVAQHYRDVRITPIYEGTNGIQALDFVNRKLGMDGGLACRALIADLRPTDVSEGAGSRNINQALDAVENNVAWMCARLGSRDAAAGATPFLRQFAMAISAALLEQQSRIARARLEAGIGDAKFLAAKINTARFYAEQILPGAIALSPAIVAGYPALSGYE